MTSEAKSASSSQVLCAERRYLEAQIAECLSKLNDNSREASKLARSENLNVEMFELLRTESAAQQVRMTALRDCLDYHRGWHGC
jgi:hypothetical protein